MIYARCHAVVNVLFQHLNLKKFDFCSHPDAEELSVWLRMQDSSSIELLMLSIQMVMTLAMNSREFRGVHSLHSIGSSKRHAFPDMTL
jgi:hypothetical protein